MAIGYLECSDETTHLLRSFPAFKGKSLIELQLPMTGSDIRIDLLITGMAAEDLPRLAATISDWNIPPVALFILPAADYTQQSEMLSHHPRVGRSIFFCKDTTSGILDGLNQIESFRKKREELPIDHSISGNFNINNISPRWLFQTLMEHLDEYIYFKDLDSRFLAVSRYLAKSTGKEEPDDVLGMTDHDLFDKAHSDIAFSDERKITTGELTELNKEESVMKNGETHWVASRKLPFRTRSGYLAGSFGLSRDITEEKELHETLKKNHERMRAELLMAKNLQSTLMQPAVPEFIGKDGSVNIEVATRYIPSFHLSGDFFSISKTVDGGAGILVADVMGHGVRAAMVTAMIQITVQQLIPFSDQPAEFMSRLNAMMHNTMQTTGQTIFATAVYCHINLETKQLTYAQAGARHGVYVPSTCQQRAGTFNNNSIHPALGLLPGTHYTDEVLNLNAGDTVVLYTDGIVEAARAEEEYTETRMVDFLMQQRESALSDILQSLLVSVGDFTQSKELEDDVCLVALRVV